MATRKALLIGNAQFDDQKTFAPLKTPTNDVADFSNVLRKFGNYQVTTLVDADAPQIREAIEGFYTDAKRGDLTLLYYSGHGYQDQDGSLYLVAKNTIANRMLSTGIGETFIQQVLRRHARVRHRLIILDCCFSGKLIDGRRSGENEPLVLEELSGEATAILTSSSRIQPSFEEEGDRNALFTQFLIEGIRTGAADEDGDGRITFDDLFNYIQPRVRARRADQTPNRLIQGDVPKLYIAEIPPGIDDRVRDWHMLLARAYESDRSSVRRDQLSLLEEMRTTPEFNPTAEGLRVILHSLFIHDQPALAWVDRDQAAAVQPLVQIEEDQNADPAVRCKAAAALGYLGHKKTFDNLVSAFEAERRQKRSARSAFPLEALAHYLMYAPHWPPLPWRLRGPCEAWLARLRWRTHKDYLGRIDHAAGRLSLGAGLVAGLIWGGAILLPEQTSDGSLTILERVHQVPSNLLDPELVGIAIVVLLIFSGLGFLFPLIWVCLQSRSQIALENRTFLIKILAAALLGGLGLVLLLPLIGGSYGLATGVLLGIGFAFSQQNRKAPSKFKTGLVTLGAGLVSAVVSLLSINYFAPLSDPPCSSSQTVFRNGIFGMCLPDNLVPGLLLMTFFAGILLGLAITIAGQTANKETNPIL